jgi:phosphatidylserine/phosphatidylglycerophosphate/cardiolipin synthase-like enzyme
VRNRSLLLVVLLVAAPAVPAASAAPATTGPTPAVVGLYPDPVADGDPGEFVVLEVPSRTNLGRYDLTDGEATVALPNRTVGGRVVLSADPARARNLTDRTVIEIDLPGLANGGERVALLRDGRTVSAARYREATEGAVYRRTGDGWRWRPLGATSFRPFRAEHVSADLFVLPDAPEPAMRTLRSADRRLLVGGYTLSSQAVADALIAAHRRGVRVRVLLEGKPVGRRSAREAAVLDRLTRAGVEVRVMAGAATRYDYHHAKYAVADDRALVLTENWKPAGVGGHSSRGWGAVVRDRAVADRLAELFRADAGGRDAVPWSRFRQGRRFEDRLAANGSYPTRFEPEPVRLEAVRLLVTPDNGGRAVRGLLANATDRIRVQQVGLGGEGPFTRALVRAARRGVEVRVLLSGAWYVREENRRLADRLNRQADSEDIPLTVRLVEPDDRFEKVHTKGAVVDGERVLLGSLNWNGHAAENNRETMLVLEGEAAASYYGSVFAADWTGPSAGGGGGAGLPLPPGAIAALGLAALAALAGGRRLEFD